MGLLKLASFKCLKYGKYLHKLTGPTSGFVNSCSVVLESKGLILVVEVINMGPYLFNLGTTTPRLHIICPVCSCWMI